MPSAYDVGFAEGSANQRQKQGRAYESDKANKAYLEGYAAGLKKLFADQMIVKCNREGRIFPAFPQGDRIDCPECGRRYFKEGDTYSSDRELTILVK